MKEIIVKDIAKKLMKQKGELRGAVFRADVRFILREKGREGLKKEKYPVMGFFIVYNLLSLKFFIHILKLQLD